MKDPYRRTTVALLLEDLPADLVDSITVKLDRLSELGTTPSVDRSLLEHVSGCWLTESAPVKAPGRLARLRGGGPDYATHAATVLVDGFVLHAIRTRELAQVAEVFSCRSIELQRALAGENNVACCGYPVGTTTTSFGEDRPTYTFPFSPGEVGSMAREALYEHVSS